jgi:hypothetical protein
MLTWEVEHIHPTTYNTDEMFDHDMQGILKLNATYKKCERLGCNPRELE